MAENKENTLLRRAHNLPKDEHIGLLAALMGIVQGHAISGHESAADILKHFESAVERVEGLYK